MQTQDHWASLGRRLARMGPPQVPGPNLARQIKSILMGCQGLTILLGATPAYADLGDEVLAFDGSDGMIAAIWPGDAPHRRARVADWTALPVPSGTAQQVLGDGSLNSVPDRATVRAVLSEMRRVLAPGGQAAIRVFLRPDPAQTVEEVLQEARAGAYPSLNVLRWRLAAALAQGPGHEVAVTSILDAVRPLGDLGAFALERGLDPTQSDHFEAYRGSPARYVFPDCAALEADAALAGLQGRWIATEGYFGADLCPIILLRVAT